MAYKLQPIWAKSQQIKAQSGASNTKPTLMMEGALHSLAVFDLIPGSSDKSHVKLGHGGILTIERHSLGCASAFAGSQPLFGLWE